MQKFEFDDCPDFEFSDSPDCQKLEFGENTEFEFGDRPDCQELKLWDCSQDSCYQSGCFCPNETSFLTRESMSFER